MMDFRRVQDLVQDWTFVEWLGVANLLLVGLGVFVAYRQLRRYRKERALEDKRRRREEAFKFSVSARPQIQATRGRLADAFADVPEATQPNLALPIQSILHHTQANPSLEGDLKVELAYYEMIGLSVAAKATDEDMIFEILGTSVVRAGKRFQEYITYIQRENPRAYVYLQALAKRWERRLRRAGASRAFDF